MKDCAMSHKDENVSALRNFNTVERKWVNYGSPTSVHGESVLISIKKPVNKVKNWKNYTIRITFIVLYEKYIKELCYEI